MKKKYRSTKSAASPFYGDPIECLIIFLFSVSVSTPGRATGRNRADWCGLAGRDIQTEQWMDGKRGDHTRKVVKWSNMFYELEPSLLLLIYRMMFCTSKKKRLSERSREGAGERVGERVGAPIRWR